MSSNPMEPPSSSSPSSSAHSPLTVVIPSRRRRRRNTHTSVEDGTTTREENDSSSVNNANIEEAPPSPTSRNRRRRRQRRARQNRARQQQQIPSSTSRRTQSQALPLPFIMPIWMVQKMSNNRNNNTTNNNSNSNLASPRAANGNGNGYIIGAWRHFRNMMPGRGQSSYESVATTAQQLSIYQYSPGSTPSDHRDSDTQNTPPSGDIEQMHSGEEGLILPTLEESNNNSPSSRSSEGLRRRANPSTPTRRARSASSNSSGSPMSSPSTRSSPPSVPNSPNLSSASSSTSSSGGEERAAPVSPPTVSLTQRAIQLQMRQAQLHSRGGSSELQPDNDDESYDSDASLNDQSSSSGDDSGSSTSSGDADNDSTETGCSRKNVYGVMRLSFAVGIFHLFALVALHATYIGPYAFRKPGMIRLSPETQGFNRDLLARLDSRSKELALFRHLLREETSNGQNVINSQTLVNCISYALSTRPENERSKYYAMFGDSDSKTGRRLSADDESGLKSVESSTATTPFMGKDEILQIKIMHGGKCTGQCSRVRRVDYTNTTTQDDSSAEKIRLLDQSLGVNPFLRATNKRRNVEEVGDDMYSSPAYWEAPHYRFSMDDALLYIDEKSALLHNISVVNVTLTERCLSTGKDNGKYSFFTSAGEFLSKIYGMDSVIINQLMYGILGSAGSLQSGYVQNMETKERWGWTKQQLESYEGNDSAIDWLLKKMGELHFLHLVILYYCDLSSNTSFLKGR